jgi:hypothetical protein
MTTSSSIICLAANKSDLPAKVDYNEVFEWADHHVEVTRASVKDGANIDALFSTVARELDRSTRVTKPEPIQAQPVPQPVAIDQPTVKVDGKPAKSGGCCK